MTEKLRKAIPLGMATIIGVLAVLGVEGELLDRFIRDHPRQVAIALVLGILGVTVPLLASAWASKKWGQVVGILLIASGATIATVTGADGVGEREQPDITVTPLAISADTDAVSLKIEAVGTHLRSRDRMLLRVSGVSARDPREQCANAGFGGQEIQDVYWGESGPNLRGDASTTASVKVSSREHRYACIYSALTDSPGKNVDDPRQTTVVLDLDRVAVPAVR